MSIRRLVWNLPIISMKNQIRYYSCWSCGTNVTNLVSNLFCSNCKALQKPDKLDNYFKILGVKETYDQDESELAKKYKELQKYLHPDKYANRNKEEQEVSAQYSSLVNEAYKTLLEPLSRGIYMLRLRGKEIPENTEIDQEFLMKIMEKNEEVENADTEEEIMKLNEENKTVIKNLQKQLSTAFFDGDHDNFFSLFQRNGPQPDQLQHTMMLVIDQEDCKARYQTVGAIIADSMMCAGRTDIDGIDGCFGDSGGPLIYKGVVVGLVSFGYACGLRYYPGVYTKVSHYTNWIISTISNNK